MADRSGGGHAAGASRPTLIVVRKHKKHHTPHHGGAWKVAYADFVTAMMAFFLLMWLLNATTEEQRLGIANYFAPTNIFGAGESGTGKPFGGSSPLDDGSLVGRAGTPTVEQQPQGGPPPEEEATESSGENEARADAAGDRPKPYETGGNFANPRTVGAGGEEATDRGGADSDGPHPLSAAGSGPAGNGTAGGAGAAIAAQAEAEAAAAEETRALEEAAEAIREAIASDPGLQELARQVAVDVTPEGLRVQLLDAERQPMFITGSSAPSERVKALLSRIAPTLAAIGNPVTIIGHTDSAPFRGGGGMTNWELSADRANVTRRLLTEAGLPDGSVLSITGVADRAPLLPADPRAPANRRIAILLQRAHAVPGS